ncbi:amidohydrolase [Halovivax asiaticus JCM 14624]|uniref:Amidohydrolase n=1 Tax=Halovivax asiaticus JCM 14624 TaxID=1227490 RepID=M0BUH4_9EURY|nr:amidohydrolase [Halovivax asiaticus]ELZ13772.1 amidohydrolase [Halovivax asiaticus JCM 14624]
MTEAADLVLLDGEVHTLAGATDGTGTVTIADDGESEDVQEAIAVRDGEIVRVGRTVEIEHLQGVETTVIDCAGRTVVPGFIDAHTHMETQGLYLVHADLSDAASLDDALAELDRQAETGREWILGFGYDESEWPESRYPTREDLDAISDERPVVAMRVDMHTASLNSVALDRLLPDLPADDVRTADGEPTGVVVEDAATQVWGGSEDSNAETRELVTAAIDHATSLGVTGVHEKVRHSRAPRIYRELDRDGDLDCRVRLDYWSDHLETAIDVGLATNAGSDFVRTGGIKSFTDGSIGARTAKLFDPYEDVDGTGSGATDEGPDDGRGQWVVEPDELREVADRAVDYDFQLTVHAIGDEAIGAAIDVLADTGTAPTARHRIEHVELATDEQLASMADAGIVASMQPNFHQWAQPGGLYDQRLGEARRKRSNRLRDVLEAGAPLAFGSDSMPLDPLFGIHHAVNAPTPSQRLSVSEAIRAYTIGAAYAGFDEDRLGTIEVGKRADLAVLEESPWEEPDRIDEIDVVATLVDGTLVFDDC